MSASAEGAEATSDFPALLLFRPGWSLIRAGIIA